MFTIPILNTLNVLIHNKHLYRIVQFIYFNMLPLNELTFHNILLAYFVCILNFPLLL